MVRPAYQRIADQLRDRITDGDLGPGDQLPTQDDLIKQYGAARGTVIRAIDLLVNEGLVVSRRPLGVFVRDRRPMIHRPQAEHEPAPSVEMDRFMGQITAEGRIPAQTIAVEVVKPPSVVAEQLGTGDDVVVVRKRIRSVDDEPYYTNDSYFPRGLVEGSEIMLPLDIARGANEVLAELGAEQPLIIHSFRARMPTPDEARRMDLPAGTAVIYKVSTGFDPAGRPVRCVIDILPGDRNVLVFEQRRPE